MLPLRCSVRTSGTTKFFSCQALNYFPFTILKRMVLKSNDSLGMYARLVDIEVLLLEAPTRTSSLMWLLLLFLKAVRKPFSETINFPIQAGF